ncbi:MAG: flagellar biosynthesis/type III secretory pathway protein [Lachnospiraceae bacterium]|nr:flagellar biosynthesis/type III secretory pathway protein [Lachnospiraceae bacterium]
MRNDFLKEKKQQQNEYVEMLESMESDLVGIMLEVFEKVTKVLSADKKDIMVHLIDNALNHIESSKEFVIRVSKDDYQFVTKHKEFLQEAVPQNGSLEIVKDATLERNQCLIETDGGIFDCSLDVQLENLIMDVKALSCM